MEEDLTYLDVVLQMEQMLSVRPQGTHLKLACNPPGGPEPLEFDFKMENIRMRAELRHSASYLKSLKQHAQTPC